MFEALTARAARAAERRAVEQAQRIAARLDEALPADVRVRVDGSDVQLAGRALGRRLALDPALKWTIAELIR